MNINYLIQLLENRTNALNLGKDQAFQSGDLERINAVDAEILDVQNTLTKLKLISSIEETALVTPFTEAEVVKNGIEASFNPTILNDTTEVLMKYNIEPYATDPYHEMKVQNILEKMGLMDNADQIEIYLRKTAPDSPLTGAMVFNICQKYSVDARIALALMEQDSRFGTQGIGARTFNPGNVGNTGTAEKNYGSWEAGVEAVVSWLNDHRRIPLESSAVVDTTPTNTDDEIDSSETTREEVTKPSNTPEATPQQEELISNTAPIEQPSINTSTTSEATTTPSIPPEEIPKIIEPVIPAQVETEASSTATSTVSN